MSDLVESIFSDMPTVGSKKSSFVVVSYPRKLWTPVCTLVTSWSKKMLLKIFQLGPTHKNQYV